MEEYYSKKMKAYTTQPKKGEKKAATPPLRRYKTKLPMYYFKFRQHLPSFVPTQHCVNPSPSSLFFISQKTISNIPNCKLFSVSKPLR